ncbi:MAG TPA: hypothetical protein VHB46_19370 [Burkholderiales bacterium]|nr:hypothetical protein [Burkholderiales bacterium]
MNAIRPLNAHASLLEIEGVVVVRFNGLDFSRDDAISFVAFTPHTGRASSGATLTAGEFVSACMVGRFQDPQSWPQLARRLVYPEFNRARART